MFFVPVYVILPVWNGSFTAIAAGSPVSILGSAAAGRFSRRKVICTPDSVSAGLYTILFFILYNGLLNYFAFLAGSVPIGPIDSVSDVAATDPKATRYY